MGLSKDKPIRVLLVEDNEADALLLREALEDKGATDVELTPAHSLKQAFEVLEGAAFDAVLLDLGLPDSMGLETVNKFLAVRRDLPVVVLTGLDDDEVGLEAISHGVQDYLVKGSIGGDVLLRTLLYAINRQETFNMLMQQIKFQQDLIDAVAMPVFYFDESCMVVGGNVAFAKVVGGTREDLPGRSLAEILPEGLSQHLCGLVLSEESELEGEHVEVGGQEATMAAKVFKNLRGEPSGWIVTIERRHNPR